MDVATLGLSVDSRPVVKAGKDLRDFGNQADQVERQTSAAMDTISASIRSMAAPLAGVLGGAFAVDGLFDQSRLIADSNILAQTLEMNTTRLQEWQFAGEQVGISAEKMGDIFKDTADKIGDFTANGGGEAADLFNNLKINMAELQSLSPDQQLLKVGDAISRIEDASQRVTYFEMLADDASRLLPLLRDNGAELQRFSEQARSLGIAMNQEDIDRVMEAHHAVRLLTASAQGLSNEMLSSLGPGIAEGISGITDFIQKAGGAEEIIDTLGTVATGLAVIYGVKLATAIGKKTASTTKDIVESQRAAVAEAKRIEMAESAVLASTREAEADAVAIRNKAAKAQQVAATARIEAAAQLDSIKWTQQQLVAERLLEQQRMAAQISATGRMQSATRLAEITKAQAVIDGQVEASTKALTAATEAERVATTTLKASKVELAVASKATDAAMLSSAAASKAATASYGALAVAARTASGALALVGGPVGAVLMAVSAFALLGPELDDNGKRMEELSDKAKTAAKRINELSLATNNLSIMSQQNALYDAAEALEAQKKAAEEARVEIERLQRGVKQFDAPAALGGDPAQAAKFRSELESTQKTYSDLQANVVNAEAAYDKIKVRLGETFASQEKLNEALSAGNSEMATTSGYVSDTAKSFDELLGQFDAGAKALNAFNKVREEISESTASDIEKTILLDRATAQYLQTLKDIEAKERERAAAAQYSVSVYEEMRGQFDAMQRIQNDYIQSLREIHSAEMTQLQRKELLYQADQKRIKALQDLKAQELAVLEARMQGGQDTGAVNMDYINRSGESSNLKSSQVFETSARQLADAIKSGLQGPDSIASRLGSLQTMASQYGALGEGFDVVGMRAAINNLAAMASDQFRQGADKPMTVDEYAAVLKNSMDEGDRIKEKQEGAYDKITEIDAKLGQLAMTAATKKNLGEVTIHVSDGKGGTSSATVTGDFADVNAIANVFSRAASAV